MDVPEFADGSRVIFGAPDIREPEIAEVVDTLRSGWIGTGPKTRRFEADFAHYLGVRHAVGTNSGTAALHLALLGLGIGPGDEVITTPLTFAATANVIEHCGARPVFADVSPVDGLIDPDAVDAAQSRRTRAILPVHYAGALAPVAELCSRHPDVPVVVDAAHAVDGRYADGTSSAGADAVCTAFSFYVTKNLVTGEGGMLVTDRDDLAEAARIRGLHGLDADAWGRYASGRYGMYDLRCAGFKYNMTDIQASLGLHQLRRLEENLRVREAIWAQYDAELEDLEAHGIELPRVPPSGPGVGRHARHLYTLRLDWEVIGLTRADFVGALADLGIGTGWHFPAVHLLNYYARKYGYRPGAFPHAESIASRTISLPLSPRLSQRDVERTIDALYEVVTGSGPPARTRRGPSRAR